MKNDLSRIQKLYGEDFAKKFCRPNFSHLIEREDFSFANFLISIVAPSKHFYDDLISHNKLEEFKNSIWGMFREEEVEVNDVEETPEQLMKKAGYTLYRCETNKDMLRFKKYYAEEEEICTYQDPSRINFHTIFWAVKDNVDEIKREDFIHPKREDAYGTSVLSIQFTKGFESTVSIINRYNLSVKYGDATFSNNLEKIHPGLTKSFKKYYGINLIKGRRKFELPGYIVDGNGVYHRYNHRIEDIYYCDNNIVVVNGVAKQFKPEQYILADYYVFDRRKKSVELLSRSGIQDSFVEQFYGIQKIEAEVKNQNKIVRVYCQDVEPIEIELNKYGQIISFTNNNVEYIGNGFMCYCQAIENLKLNNAKYIGNDFLMDNTSLKYFEAEKVEEIANRALCSNVELKSLKLNKVSRIGDYFLTSNKKLNKFTAKKLERVGMEALFANEEIKSLTLPKLKEVKFGFMKKNVSIERFSAPLLNSQKYDKYLNERMREIKKNNIMTKILQKIDEKKEEIFHL